MSQLLHSPHEASIVNALQWQGFTNNCAPFTLATIVNALTGSSIDGAWLAKQMNKPVWRGVIPVIRRIPNWMTFPWGMVDVLREYGFRARWGINSTFDTLRYSLQQGNISIPVVGSWKPISSHVMTIVAWDSSGSWGFANTQLNEKKIDWVSEDWFKNHWKLTARMLVEVKLS